MYTTQVDLYEIIKRFSEPARTPETLIFVIYLRFRPARVLSIFNRFRGPSSGPPGRFLGPPSATPLPTQKARNRYFYNVLALDRRPPEALHGTPNAETQRATRPHDTDSRTQKVPWKSWKIPLQKKSPKSLMCLQTRAGALLRQKTGKTSNETYPGKNFPFLVFQPVSRPEPPQKRGFAIK